MHSNSLLFSFNSVEEGERTWAMAARRWFVKIIFSSLEFLELLTSGTQGLSEIPLLAVAQVLFIGSDESKEEKAHNDKHVQPSRFGAL